MSTKPYYTSADIISSVKRKISFPISQNTFTENDILAFANEEMFLSQVPSVLQYHQEYFTSYRTVPLRSNVSRYSIPERATGMKLRDLFYQDTNGNLYDMTRVDESNRAYFQANVGSNQGPYTYFIQGNDVILAPGVAQAPSGNLVFIFFLRPNQLVKNGRSATVSGFSQSIKVNNSLVSPLDTVTIGEDIFTAVNTLGGTITAISAYSSTETQITCVNHQLSSNQLVVITGSDSNPSINGTYPVQVLDDDNFIIQKQISVAGTTGTFTSPNQFLIGVSDVITASNLSSAVSAITSLIPNILGATVSLDIATISYADIYTNIVTSNTYGFIIPQELITFNFENLASTYLDQETNIVEPLFVNGALIDILQTNPGHKTYTYDIKIPTNGISGNSIIFVRDQLKVPTFSNLSSTNVNQPSSIAYELPTVIIGDYICLANESIIPQIPPDLHNGLAERTAARILSAMGDQAGLQASMTKIAEIDSKQGNLLDNRVESSPIKIVNRYSNLRMGKLGRNRRF